MKQFYYLLFFSIGFSNIIIAQTTARPMIWVKASDRPAILDKIKNNPWVQDYYNAFTKRVQADLAAYKKDPIAYLSELPFDVSLQKPNQIPPFKTVYNADNDATVKRNKLQHYLKTGIDCGVLYYLTEDEKYAQYATTVFNTFIKSMLQIEPSDTPFNGGFIYQDDHLREAREVGAQIPIIYDFIYPYLQKGGKAFNFVTQKDEPVAENEAEKVFKTYIDLALNRGIVDCNWPVLESPGLVGNALALRSEQERLAYLAYYLEKNTPHQDALPKVANVFKEGGNWPESINYSNAVTELTTYLLTVLTKVYPELHLGLKYPEVLNAITVPYYLTYPNNHENILFGDGHRNFHAPVNNYEMAYYLGCLEKSPDIKNKYGALLKRTLADNSYNRSTLKARSYAAHPYFDEPLKLLWFSATIEGETKEFPKPVTNELPFAGILLQRNLSASNNPKDALMGFVGGGAFVHGHASGMNMELYGQGHVLGTKGGRGAYTTEIHENYYRLFAGHNTVVVNGASQGAGKWVNLGINTVKEVAIEPKPFEEAVSPNYSFTTSGFLDDKGDSAKATQERTLGIIRTSPTTGYYVDIFRSKSTLPKQYHDYIYHNVGEQLTFQTNDKYFLLKPDSQRYQYATGKPWVKNKAFRNPGWHYFDHIETSGIYTKSINVLFEAKALEKAPVKMKLFIPESNAREYTKVMAPPSTESENAYKKKPTPTLVIRQNGATWDNPFVVVYESFEGNQDGGSVISVATIKQNGIFKGLIVESSIRGKIIQQIIISQDNDQDVFKDEKLGIQFKGRYAVLTLNSNKELENLYVGNGADFSYRNWLITAEKGVPAAYNLQSHPKEIIVVSNSKISVSNPTKKKLSIKSINN